MATEAEQAASPARQYPLSANLLYVVGLSG